MTRQEWLEWGLILLAIASLWPKILHWSGWFWEGVLYLVAGLLALLLWVRVRRFRHMLKEQQRLLGQGGPPFLHSSAGRRQGGRGAPG